MNRRILVALINFVVFIDVACKDKKEEPDRSLYNNIADAIEKSNGKKLSGRYKSVNDLIFGRDTKIATLVIIDSILEAHDKSLTDEFISADPKLFDALKLLERKDISKEELINSFPELSILPDKTFTEYCIKLGIIITDRDTQHTPTPSK